MRWSMPLLTPKLLGKLVNSGAPRSGQCLSDAFSQLGIDERATGLPAGHIPVSSG